MLDVNNIADWLVSAPRGDTLEYHFGQLARDAAYSKQTRDSASYMMAASDAGFVNLVQKRLAADSYLYLAQRTSAPYQPGVIKFR